MEPDTAFRHSMNQRLAEQHRHPILNHVALSVRDMRYELQNGVAHLYPGLQTRLLPLIGWPN